MLYPARTSLALLLLLVVGFWMPATDAATFNLAATDQPQNPALAMEYLRDPGNKLTFDEILALPDSHWTANHQPVPAFGYDTAGYWFRIRLHNPTGHAKNMVLEIGYPILKHIQVFLRQHGQTLKHYKLGDSLRFNTRPINDHNFVIPVPIEAGGNLDLYLKVRTESSIQVPMTLWERDNFFERQQLFLVGQGLYFGIMLVMGIYNLFIYITVRHNSYIYYAGSVIGMGLFMSAIHGFGFQYLWPDRPGVNEWILPASLGMFGICAIAFTNSLLQLKKNSPRYYYVLASLAIAYIPVMISSFFLPYRDVIKWAILIGVLGCITGLASSIYVLLQGVRAARFYVKPGR